MQVLNLQTLINNCQSITGKTLGQLATNCNLIVPSDTKRQKGWVGQLLEHVLGADAGSRPEPDFRQLGIELKTLPINTSGNPTESTFVCTTPLLTIHQQSWPNSTAYKKLNKVLWVPIEADNSIALPNRRVGLPILWQPTEVQARQLRADWQMLVDKISLGELESISAHHGEYLQLRPKAAHGKVLCQSYGPSGEIVMTLPRGFYLRARFTQQILVD